MCNQDLECRIAPAVKDVLETMFFSSILDSGELDLRAASIAVRVPFEGESSGVQEIRISEPGARSLAASFLGEDEESLDREQVEQTACELANMICGAVVSKPEFGGCLVLGSPQLLSSANECADPATAIRRDFPIANGTLSVLLFTGVQV